MAKAPSMLVEATTRHAAFTQGVLAQHVTELRALLADIEESLLGRLARNDITKWSRARAETQLQAFGAMARQKYDEQIIPELNRQIKELAVYEAGFEQRSLANVAPKHQFTLPTETQIMAAVTTRPLSVRGADGGKLLDSFVKDWTGDQVARVTNTVRMGFAQGETTASVVRMLRDEALPVNRRALEGLARTALQHAAQEARQATFEANSDIVKRVRIVATLDSRTSDQCMALDGREFPIDSGPRPPFHVNCRTTFTAVLDERFDFLDKGATRRARDPETGDVGYVPAKQTYYSWLKGQPEPVQSALIGPTRAKLLRDGGLSAQRFQELQLNRNFRPRTLADMRKIDELAFIRAGIE